MNCGTRLGLTVLLMCAYGFAQKKDPEMAKIFAASQYVFVETIYGPLETTTLDSRVSPEDRRAVFNVEDAVRSWGRYRLTLNRSDASLGGPLWNRTLDHGLDAPGLPLFKKFKDEVEASSKTQTKKTP
ncbi:MAG: hypothetical protein DMG53_01670 [Acidobacteria bacterium]|nr:MAG: hypothetical protein DMG53_01670 [Acidobacteriota bacterium]